MKRYPKALCDNPKCRQCYYFNKKSVCCTYFLKTGKRKNGCGETCDSFEPNNKAKKKNEWLYKGGKNVPDTR